MEIRERRQKNLKQLMDKHGMRDVDLARALGKFPSQVSAWFSDPRSSAYRGIGPKLRNQLADFFKIAPEDLDKDLPDVQGNLSPPGGDDTTKAMQAYLRIVSSGDETVKAAIMSNVLAFNYTLDLAGRVRHLEILTEELRRKIADLEKGGPPPGTATGRRQREVASCPNYKPLGGSVIRIAFRREQGEGGV